MRVSVSVWRRLHTHISITWFNCHNASKRFHPFPTFNAHRTCTSFKCSRYGINFRAMDGSWGIEGFFFRLTAAYVFFFRCTTGVMCVICTIHFARPFITRARYKRNTPNKRRNSNKTVWIIFLPSFTFYTWINKYRDHHLFSYISISLPIYILDSATYSHTFALWLLLLLLYLPIVRWSLCVDLVKGKWNLPHITCIKIMLYEILWHFKWKFLMLECFKTISLYAT